MAGVAHNGWNGKTLMYMDNNGWKWLDMTGNCRKYLYMAVMAEHGWKVLEWLERAVKSWKLLEWLEWLEIAGNCF